MLFKSNVNNVEKQIPVTVIWLYILYIQSFDYFDRHLFKCRILLLTTIDIFHQMNRQMILAAMCKLMSCTFITKHLICTAFYMFWKIMNS